MSNINIWCKVRENRYVFKIKIGTDNDLFDLKKAILEELPNAENLKAIQLTLWKVNIDQQNVFNPVLNDDNKLLNSRNTVGATFPDLRGTNIRVVVRAGK